ncbi:PEP-CTERM sorting domain-containing protein [Pelagicoccus sp. SDUM812002]|uniref:PEP-CTERM sorting domain-containing protein n=1 Tax=Pelagicoccus sp. SDUM812002 TaxID=3041266 RepID=UPI00280D4ACA|nr:PEP-CTERM sorting domain-containing protein [Pelagicoccus sp. SDUM812002]MDQ8188394.1 PEP-CTERM sorting domain-containing protein [Pelagicoccus sp. SDUM812002]
MTALSLLRRGVIGIQLLFLGASITCAQTFVFDFESNAQNDVFLDAAGTTPVGNWNGLGNTLDDEDGTQNQSGFLFFDFDNEGPLESVQLGSMNYLNWTDDGLGDAGSGLNNQNEFISFTFNQDGRIDVLDFGAFTGSESLSILRTGETDIGFLGDDAAHGSVLSPSLLFAAGQTVTVRNNSGAFFLESMTISAVPEPGTIVFSFLGASIAFVLARRRPRAGGRAASVQ